MPPRNRRESISSLGRPQRRATTQHEAVRVERPARQGPGGWIRGALVDNAGLKLLSLILALTVYLLVNTDDTRDITARVRVAYLLPPDKAPVSELIDEVEVRIRGPWRRIKRFDEREIDRIDLDLTDVQSGEIAISADRINLPRGLEVLSVSPRTIRVAFEDKVSAVVDVEPTIGGRPLHGYTAPRDQIRVDPKEVRVRGAVGVIRALSSVRTQEVRIDGASEEVDGTVRLVPPDGVELVDGDLVTVTVPIGPAVVVKKLAAVPVTVRLATGATGAWADPKKWGLDHAEVELEVSGYLLDVERWIDNGVVVAVVVPADATVRGARAEVAVVVDGVPQGVGVKVSPAKLSVAPRK